MKDQFSREKSFEAIVSTAIDAIVVLDENNIIHYFNPGAEKLLGWTSEEVVGQDMGMLIPEQYREAHLKGMRRYVETGVAKVLGTSYVHLPSLHKKGYEIPTNISIATWKEDGNIFFTGIIRDVTGTIEYQERQDILIKELNHRVKNTISIIQGLVNQTGKFERDVETFRQELEDRLVAMAKVHDLLVDQNWSHTTIGDMINRFMKVHKKLYTCDVVNMKIKSRAAVTLGMALHELITNSIKYGAWSMNGSVDLRTELEGNEFKFVWKEKGGPMVSEPTQEGFGTTLLTRVVGSSLRGKTKLEFEPDGVRFELTAPLSNELLKGD